MSLTPEKETIFRKCTAGTFCKRLHSCCFFCILHCQQIQLPSKVLLLSFIWVYRVKYNMVALNVQWEEKCSCSDSPQHLCCPLPVHACCLCYYWRCGSTRQRSRATDLFVSHSVVHSAGMRREGWGVGVVLTCLQYLFTSTKTEEFWEKRDGEALSQRPPCPLCSPCWGCCCWLLWQGPLPAWTLWHPRTLTDTPSNCHCSHFNSSYTSSSSSVHTHSTHCLVIYTQS